MDSGRFDEISRRLAGATTRRGALAALLAAGLGVGGAGLSGREAAAKKKCRPRCGAGQRCEKGACVCTEGTACGASCCRIGQECRDGQCVTMPEPTTCIAFGEPCKNAGRPCCDNLQCGSGQGGSPVACWVRKTGRCTSTAECIYGTECKEGICVGLPTCDPASCTCPALEAIAAALEPNCDSGACGCTCKAITIDVQGDVNEFQGRSCRGDECGDFNQGYLCVDMTGGGISGLCGPDSVNCCCVKRPI